MTNEERAVRALNIGEVKADFSRLIRQAAEGRSFIIAKAGRPMVKVEPVDVQRAPRDQPKS